MGTPAQIGKHQYNAALKSARQANENMRNVMRRLMNEAPNHLIRALVGQLAMEVSECDSALNRLGEIGEHMKETKSSKAKGG